MWAYHNRHWLYVGAWHWLTGALYSTILVLLSLQSVGGESQVGKRKLRKGARAVAGPRCRDVWGFECCW